MKSDLSLISFSISLIVAIVVVLSLCLLGPFSVVHQVNTLSLLTLYSKGRIEIRGAIVLISTIDLIQ